MGPVDLVLLAVLAISMIVGLLRGFVFEVLSLVGWVVAYIATQFLTPLVSPHIPVGTTGSALNHAVTFAVTFIGVLILWGLIVHLLRGAIRASPLNLPDRALGAAFGFLRGAVILLAFATVVAMTPWENSSVWQTSKGASWLNAALKQIRPLLPREVAQYLPY